MKFIIKDIYGEHSAYECEENIEKQTLLQRKYLDILKKNKFRYTKEEFIENMNNLELHYFYVVVDIENMEELMKLKEKVGHELIITHNNYFETSLNVIEIYDDYRE